MLKETSIKNIITPTGVNSLPFFRMRIAGISKLGQLDRPQFNQIRRHILVPDLVPWIEKLLEVRVPPFHLDDLNAIWHKDKLTNISSLTTKEFRESRMSPTPITEFKIGINWCYRIRQLHSTRHQNTIHKVAHGDIYTNDRLLRFGLRDNDNCDRCGNTDSRLHRIAKCPKAVEIWNEVRRLSNLNPLANRGDAEALKEVLGTKDLVGNELAIHAEILQLLTNNLDTKVGTLPARIIVRILLKKLYTLEKGKTKENIKALLDKITDDE